jgi:hypothetical protein
VSKVILNPDKITYEMWAKYTSYLGSGDPESAFVVIRPAIVDWDFEVPLEGDRPDLKLPFLALPEILASIRDTIENFNDTLDDSAVTVDLNKAGMAEYYGYVAALKAGNLKPIEDYYKLVADPNDKDYDPAKRLSLRHGLIMRKAVERVTEELFRQRKAR